MKKNSFIFLIFLFVISCKPIKEIQYVEKTKIEFRDRVQIDSVLIKSKDSSYSYFKNDTLFIGKLIYKETTKYKFLIDSIYKDISNVEIKTVVKYEQKPFSKFQKFLIKFSLIFSFVFLLLLFAYRNKIFQFIKNIFIKF